MNPVLSVPARDTFTIFLKPKTATVDTRQGFSNFFYRLLLSILIDHKHTGIICIAAQHQNMVNFVLRKRKSRELSALCFIYNSYLFFFGKEQVEGQLLISSVITTSSACAFRLFMCCTQPI